MKRSLYIATALSFLFMMLFWGLYGYYAVPIQRTLPITAMTFFYHLSMRILVSVFVCLYTKNHVLGGGKWFVIRSKEAKFYERIRIKQWKKYLPTFVPELFDLRRHSLQQVLAEMYNAELIHEIIVGLSFVPLLFSIEFGLFWVFFVTSFFSALFDALFVALQRYNRPRVEWLIKRQREAAYRPLGSKP